MWLGYLLSSVYSPYVYQQQLVDFGLVSAANIIFVLGVYFLILAVRNKPYISYFYDILFVWGGYVFLEMLQAVQFVLGTFDWADIGALTIYAMLVVTLDYLLQRGRHANYSKEDLV